MAVELLDDEDHFCHGLDIILFKIIAYEIVFGVEPFTKNVNKSHSENLFHIKIFFASFFSSSSFSHKKLQKLFVFLGNLLNV